MSEPAFFRTQMGHRFDESTMPALVRELARLNHNLEAVQKLLAAPGPQAETKKEEPR